MHGVGVYLICTAVMMVLLTHASTHLDEDEPAHQKLWWIIPTLSILWPLTCVLFLITALDREDQ